MKFTPVFGLVLAIHVVVIALLIVQPGCQSTPEAQPSVSVTMPQGGNSDVPGATTTVVRPAGSRPAPTTADAYSEPSTLDSAFNSGFSPTESPSPSPTTVSNASFSSTPVSTSGSRAAPQRPNTMFSDPIASVERPDPIPVVSNQPRFETYTVQPGDSLWKIAKDYDVTLDSILKANGLTKSSVIKVGQSVQIPLTTPELAPAPPMEEALSGTSMAMNANIPYTVQPGDNLTRIAKQFNTSVSAIKAANNRRADTIRVGETLLIPGEASTESQPAVSTSSTRSSTPTPTLSANQATHTVTAGETPASIAARYGMRTIDLIRLNGNFDPRRMQVGQVLKVEPAPGREPTANTEVAVASNPAPSSSPQTSLPSVEEQRESPQPIRVRVGNPGGNTEIPAETNPVDLFDNLEEIPVVPVEPVDPNG